MSDNAKVRFGIFYKVLLTMILVAVLPLLTIWYINYVNTSVRISQEIDEKFSNALGYLTNHVDSWVTMNHRMLRQNSALPAIRSMEASRQNQLLKLITDVYDWNYLAFTVAPDGENIGRSDGKPTRYYGDRVYVKQVLEGAQLGSQVLIGKTSKKPALVLSVPVRSGGRRLEGVLAIAATITEVSERIVATRIGDTGFAFLVDGDGKVIAHPSPELTSSRQDLSKDPAVADALINGTREIAYVDENGREVIAQMRRTDHGWWMVIQQDSEEAFAALARANRDAISLLAVTVVLVLIVALLFSRRLSIPILRLTAAADELSRGALNVPIEGTDRGDEIGLLANAISRLGTSTRLAMERLARKRQRG